MKDDVKSALEFVRKWQENDPDVKHIALGAAVTLRDHILSTVAEPTMKTFNAEWAKAFVEKCRLVYATTKHDPKLVYSDESLVAELLAAMGGRGDEGKPGNKLCESCESPATHRDIDDVPLCKACYDELPAAPGERSGE